MQKIKIRKIRINKYILIKVSEFLLGFALTRAEMFNMVLPLGIAYSTIMCSKKNSIYGGIGSFLGYILLTNSEFKYAGATLIVVALLNLLKVNPMFVSGIITFTVDILYALNTKITYTNFLMSVVSGIISFSAAYFYSKLLENNERDKIYKTSLLFFCVSIISCCLNLEIFFGIVPIRILVVLAILATTYFSKNGIILSVIFGVAIDSSINAPVFTLGYSFASIISSGLREFNKTLFCSLFLIMYSIGSVFTASTELFYISLYEVFLASLCFIFIPNKYFSFAKIIENSPSFTPITNQASSILNELSKTFENSVKPVHDISYEDIQKIYDKTVDEICKGCDLSLECWHKNYMSSIDAINQTSSTLANKGYVISTDYPSYFSTRCVKFPQFLSCVNNGLYTLKKNVTTNERLEYNKMLIAKQYKAVSSVMNDLNTQNPIEFLSDSSQIIDNFISFHKINAKCNVYTNISGKLFVSFKGYNLAFLRNLSFLTSLNQLLSKDLMLKSESFTDNISFLVFCEKDKFKIDICHKSIAKGKISGDNFTSFCNDDSKFFALLSDGMGSGESAFEQSKQILSLLEKLLKSSISCLKAINTINPIMGVKNNDDSFVSLDLTSIDLLTLEGLVAKQGAMPTYIYRNDTIHKISSTNLPLGLSPKATVSRIKFKLNDIIIMISDGIEDLSKETLCEIIKNHSDSKIICDEILKTSNCLDDKTAIVFRINLNK